MAGWGKAPHACGSLAVAAIQKNSVHMLALTMGKTGKTLRLTVSGLTGLRKVRYRSSGKGTDRDTSENPAGALGILDAWTSVPFGLQVARIAPDMSSPMELSEL